MTRGRRVAVAAAIVLALGGFLYLARPRPGPPLGNSSAPGGTLALHRFLSESGASVSARSTPLPGDTTFVLFQDFRTPKQEAPLLQWVGRGGRLVIADPASAATGALGVGPGGSIEGFGVTSAIAPGCVTPETAGVDRIVVNRGDAVLATGQAGAVRCLPASGGYAAIVVRRGRGIVVMLGGFSSFTNALLSSGDDARFALGVFGTGAVVFGPPVPPGQSNGTSSVWSALPARGKALILAIGLSVLAFAFVRGRRLGAPVPEEPISPIPASELVRATGSLYRRAHAAGFAGSLLRREASARLGRRLGVPPAEPERLAARVAGPAGIPPERAEHALAGPAPTGDEDLLALAGELDDIVDKVEGARR